MSIFDKIKKGFEHLPQELQHVPQQLQHAGLDPHSIQNWIHEEFEHGLQYVADKAAKEALRQSSELANKIYSKLTELKQSHPNLVDEIDDVSIDVSLSIVTMSYDKFYSRAAGLTKVLADAHNNFKLSRSFIRTLIKNTGPTRITFSISGELFTSAVSAGLQCGIPLALGVE